VILADEPVRPVEDEQRMRKALEHALDKVDRPLAGMRMARHAPDWLCGSHQWPFSRELSFYRCLMQSAGVQAGPGRPPFKPPSTRWNPLFTVATIAASRAHVHSRGRLATAPKNLYVTSPVNRT
jgi:hypothetical protein